MLGHPWQVSNIHCPLIINYSNLLSVLLHHLVRIFEIHSIFWRSSHIVSAHLPDEYFIPTPTDLKAAQASLSARTQALTNAPLQLRAVREAESKAKRDRWPEVLNIRPMFREWLVDNCKLDNYSHQIRRSDPTRKSFPFLK